MTTVRPGAPSTSTEVGGADPFAGYVFEPVEAPKFAKADRRPWAVYGRISRRDPREGAGAHVKIEDQLEQARAYVLALDPEAEVLEFKDNASAFLPEVSRPGFERMVAMMAAGELKGVVPIHVDRLLRQVRHASLVWDHLDRSGAQLHTVHGGWIQDPTMMQMEAVMAERESRVKRERQKNHHRRLAEEGRNHGGHRRFGYEVGMHELNEAEADALRLMAKRVLAGDSLASQVRWLEAEGFASVNGGKWTASNLGTMLRRPMLAGIRVHGKREDGSWREVAKAAWPPVFDLETHEALNRLLGDPARRTYTGDATNAATGSKYLLPTIGRCGHCGEPLRGRPGRNDKAKTAYVCATGAHVYRDMRVVDHAVSEAVVERLSNVNNAGVFVDDSAELRAAELTTKREALVARRARFVARAAAAETEAEEEANTDAAAKVSADIANVDRDLKAAKEAVRVPLAALEGMTGPMARRAWDKASTGRKRQVLRVLLKGGRFKLYGGQRKWDPETLLDLQWEEAPGLD